MTTARGAHCPSCGTWIAATNLTCFCGYDPRSEAWLGVASGLVAWNATGIAAVLVWVPLLALGICPLGMLSLATALYGVRCGLNAMQGRGLHRALGAVALLLCTTFFLVPAALILVVRLHVLRF